MFVEAVKALVKVEADWVPSEPETSLYPPVHVRNRGCARRTYGVRLQIHDYLLPGRRLLCRGHQSGEDSCRGRAGACSQGRYRIHQKCGGNYAGSILGQVKAEKLGYSQVLWLDGEHRKYVEEVGTMNIMFKIAGEIYTAPIEGTVLPGVTRDSMIHLLRDWGYKVNETRLSVDDLMKAGHDGTLEEVFGTGTAAVISPVGELRYKDDVVTINDFKIGELTQKLYDTLTGIQWGKLPDKYGWTVPVE